MQRIIRVGGIALASLVVLAPAAAAQSAPSLFLTGGVFASVERDSHVESTSYVYPVSDGTVAGGSVGAGAFLTPRVSVRVEFTFRGDLENTESRTQVFPGQVSYTEWRTLTDEVRTGSVLLAWHARNGKRVRQPSCDLLSRRNRVRILQASRSSLSPFLLFTDDVRDAPAALEATTRRE